MKSLTIAMLVLALACADNWAILVAGSDGFWNYRHQADVSHAYQIVKAGGIPEDHIITMMADDVASSSENPFPGELYNHPGDDVPNVYAGVKVDYAGKDNTPENFMKVLLGDESTGKKVLKSTENDNVFMFFSDHGGPDVLCWPSSDLSKADFQKTLKAMHEKKMFKHFVLYIEACFSGSMAIDFPEDLGISIVTAANDQESSWGWYCGDEAVVKGKDIGSCLGDEFSVFWMEDTDKGEQKTETLEEQFNRLVKGVTKSHVMRYGDKSFANDVIGEFIGYPEGKKVEHQMSYETWDSRDNEMLFRLYKAQHTTGKEQKMWQAAYEEEVANRKAIDAYFASLTTEPRMYQPASNVKNVNCYKKAIDQFTGAMGRSDYALKYFNVLANICNENPTAFNGY